MKQARKQASREADGQVSTHLNPQTIILSFCSLHIAVHQFVRFRLLESLHSSVPPPVLLPLRNPQAYALSRDHGLPLSSLLCRLTSWGVPSHAILLSGLIAVAFNLPLLAGINAYYAVVGTATTAWFTAYAVPIALRLWCYAAGSHAGSFYAGPFSLERFFGPASWCVLEQRFHGQEMVVWIHP